MATNLTALQAGIKLVADVVVDSEKAAKDSGLPTKIADFGNILPDILSLLPQIGEIPSEAKALGATDYATLMANLVADLGLPHDSKLEKIADAAIKMISDIATYIVPDAEALLAAVKG